MADEVWAREHVQTLLQRREKAGEAGLSFEELQEQGGIGPGDLEQALGVMVDEGAARKTDEGLFEFVPPEARAPAVPVDDLDPDDPDRVEAELAQGARRVVPAAAQPRSSAAPAPVAVAEFVGGPVVRLTKGMLNALSNEAVGEMIKAAAEEHTGDDELTIAIA